MGFARYVGGKMERFLGGIARLSGRSPVAVLIVVGAVTLILGAQLPNLEISYDPLAFLPKHPRVEAHRAVEENFGVGNFSHLVVVHFAPKGDYRIESPQAVLEMEAVLKTLRGVEGIVTARGIPDYVKFVHQELHGGDPRYATLPPQGPQQGYSLADVIRIAFQRMALLKQFISPEGTALATATIAAEADIREVAQRVEEALAPLLRQAIATEIKVVSYGGTLNLFNSITLRDLRLLTPAVAALIIVVLVWVFRLTRPRELGAALALIGTVAALTLAPHGPAIAWVIVGSLLLVGLIIWSFRPLAHLYLPLTVVVVSGIWTFGALGLMGIPFTFLMVAVVPLLLGVGIDDALHLLHRHEEERCKGHEGPLAIGIAIRSTGRALLLTTLTTTAGFAALLFAPSPPLRAFGLLAALAMICAFIVTVLLVPAVKHLLREGPRLEPWPPRGSSPLLARAFGHPKESWVSRLLTRYTHLAHRRAIAIALLLVGVGLGLAGYWEGHAFQTYTIDYRRMLPEEHPLARLYTQINREFRPYDEVQIHLIGDLARLEVMRLLLMDLPQTLAGSPYAHKVTSIAQVLEDVRAANAELSAGFLERFTQDPDGAYKWLLSSVFARDSLRAEAAAYARPLDQGLIEAVVRVNTMRFSDQAGISRVTRDLEARLEPILARFRELGVEAQLTGTPFLEEIGLSALKRSFLQSLVLSFIFCFVVLTLAIGSPLWGAVVLFPVALVIGLVLGSLALLRLELNAATAVVAAISIGLGIDYAIHLINRFREERDLRVAAARTGEALSAAFFSTAGAFFALQLSQIAWNRDFGLLVGLAITYAFGATVFFLTAVLALAFPTQRAERLIPTGAPAQANPASEER
jgi:predicted RND superfamily exporter protein